MGKKADMEHAHSLSPKWRENLATGIISIDQLHRNFLEKINDLIRACIDGRPKEEVIHLMGYLKGDIQTHFAEEEAFQLKHKSPELLAHKSQHDELIVRLK